MHYSPTGAHVEWCKQLIAATMSSQISGPISSEMNSREYKVRTVLLYIHHRSLIVLKEDHKVQKCFLLVFHDIVAHRCTLFSRFYLLR